MKADAMEAEIRDKWITIAEAADFLGVSADTIRRRIGAGEITARRFGPRLVRVEFASLLDALKPMRWIEDQST